MSRKLRASIALGCFLACASAFAQVAGPRPTQALHEDIAAKDRALFAAKAYPLQNYGAVQVGEHRFYKLAPGKPEQLVEVALFTHLWKQEPSGWKLARVLSYDHRLPP